MVDYWEKTMQVYGSFIEYPQLTEKYLKRPPFKYLFQIFISLNQKTNFAEGLLKDSELDAEFYDSPAKKMTFLKQVLKVVYKGLNKPCPLKPESVIKGVDCDKTNEFLQDMFQVASAVKGTGPNINMKDGSQNSPENNSKQPSINSNTSKDKNTGKPKEAQMPANSRSKEPRLKSQDTREMEVLETPETLKMGKENFQEKKQEPKMGKLTNQIKEEQKKDERVLAKDDQEKKGSTENNIKMGSLSSVGSNAQKNPITSFNMTTDKDGKENKGLNLENIKEVIQKITQNTYPMGKLIEFIEDDLDGMNKEYKKWQKLYFESTEKLEKIEGEQDEELQAYNDKLGELNEQIFEQESKIMSIRSRILKNSQKIDGMLAKIVHN